MLVLAWSLLSSYTEYARKRKLHEALRLFFEDPSSLRRMIVCRPAAHRLTLLSAAGFSSWGAETANGSLARVASAPSLTRQKSDECIHLSRSANETIYRSERAEVVALPDESLATSDWRLFSSSLSSYGPSSSSSIFFIAASEYTAGEVASGSRPAESADGVPAEAPSFLHLDSACMRIGWNRSRPSEVLYACDLSTFSEVVYAWTNGNLRSSCRKNRPIGKIRTVWLAPSFSASRAVSPSESCPASPPPTECASPAGAFSSHSSTSVSPNKTSSCSSLLMPQCPPRPLLEQLFVGDSNGAPSLSAAVTAALKQKLGSEGALNLSSHFSTMPRRSFGRRSQAYLSSFAGSCTERGTPEGGHRGSPFGSRPRLPPFPLRSSRSSLRYRAASPLAIDLPKRPGRRESARLPAVPSESLILAAAPNSISPCGSPSLSVLSNGTLPSRFAAPQLQQAARFTVSPTVSRSVTISIPPSLSPQQVPEAPVSADLQEELLKKAVIQSYTVSGGEATVSSTLSPSITISSELYDGDSHSLAEARIDYDSEQTDSYPDTVDRSLNSVDIGMPSEGGRSSSARRSKNSMRRQDTAPHSRSAREECGRGGSNRGPHSSPMLEMLRRKMSSAGEAAEVPVDPQLQRLTTIELLQRRRHSHMMYPFDHSFAPDDGGRRRSLSPMALQQSLHISGFGSGDVFRGSGSLLDTARRGTSRRMHSSSRDKQPDYKPAAKPPTVLVYTCDQPPLYNRIHSSLESVLLPNVYTIFHLSPEAIRKPHWVDPSSACLLIATTEQLDDKAWTQMQDYFNKSGKIIFVCQNSLLASLSTCESIKKQASMLRLAFGDKQHGSMSKDLEAFLKKTLKTLTKNGEVNEKYQSKDLVGGLKYSVVLSKKKDAPLLLYMESGGSHHASAVFSDATSEELLAPRSQICKEAFERVGIKVDSNVKLPSLTIGYLIADTEFLSNTKALRYGVELGGSPALFMRRADLIADHPLPLPTPHLLPLQVVSREDAPSCSSFDSRRYFAKLETLSTGRIVLYVPTITTTMDVSRSLSQALPGHDGLVVVARQQLKGVGRGGNEWISPMGMAMFTFNSILPVSCALSQNPSFVQHVVALAVTMAVHELSGQQDFPLRIKWPNDLYCNRSHKVGGILATARSYDDSVEFTIGVGVNVANSRPTTCLNDMLPDNLPDSENFLIEEVIAASLNKFELLVNLYENEGQKALLDIYYNYWLHSREEVTLGDDKERVVIRGLDQHGFLQVRSKKHPNKLYSVSDDGNTFDMMKGLIRLKIK